ncbi:hypothetical protein OF829_10080 [Sphingomonas sp. LB-2]|uniref:hypothetical protein n=1 Tax=Sphingomonas caeni TaxID=2984949 RepID=UPI002231BA34|nr:hypothetical protein [Sphingomonas caeni]MCW3847591.1 hypothetical protein [Sphingomonas caeni]
MNAVREQRLNLAAAVSAVAKSIDPILALDARRYWMAGTTTRTLLDFQTLLGSWRNEIRPALERELPEETARAHPVVVGGIEAVREAIPPKGARRGIDPTRLAPIVERFASVQAAVDPPIRRAGSLRARFLAFHQAVLDNHPKVENVFKAEGRRRSVERTSLVSDRQLAEDRVRQIDRVQRGLPRRRTEDEEIEGEPVWRPSRFPRGPSPGEGEREVARLKAEFARQDAQHQEYLREYNEMLDFIDCGDAFASGRLALMEELTRIAMMTQVVKDRAGAVAQALSGAREEIDLDLVGLGLNETKAAWDDFAGYVRRI